MSESAVRAVYLRYEEDRENLKPREQVKQMSG